MEPTAHELTCARAIKAAAEAKPEINSSFLTDLEYVQHAIVAQHRVDAALERIENLQAFKSRYDIQLDGNYEQGARDLQQMLTIFPGVFTVGETEQHVQIVSNEYINFHADALSSEEAYNIILRGTFYFLQACHPNIAAMRAGVVSLNDCHGAGWRNISFSLEKRAAGLYSHAYPVHLVQMVMLRAPVVFRMLACLVRLCFVSQPTRQAHICTAEREIWLRQSPWPGSAVPSEWGGTLTVEESRTRLLQKLKERYENAAKFSL